MPLSSVSPLPPLNFRISANRKMFNAAPTPSSNSAGSLSETSTGRPLSTLLHLLGMKPFTKVGVWGLGCPGGRRMGG